MVFMGNEFRLGPYWVPSGLLARSNPGNCTLPTSADGSSDSYRKFSLARILRE